MDPVGHARSARNATRRSDPAVGWAFTNDVSAACPNTAGAICRQVSQSMQVESTKKSPGAFSGTRLRGFATTESPFATFYRRGPGTPRSPSSAAQHRPHVVQLADRADPLD